MLVFVRVTIDSMLMRLCLEKKIKRIRKNNLFEFTLENPLVSDACVEQTPFSSGSSLQGISQPKQNRDHGHNAQIVAPSVTARKVNGKS
jgi:hypothetical protein